jgi:hypothetical protein
MQYLFFPVIKIRVKVLMAYVVVEELFLLFYYFWDLVITPLEYGYFFVSI